MKTNDHTDKEVYYIEFYKDDGKFIRSDKLLDEYGVFLNKKDAEAVLQSILSKAMEKVRKIKIEDYADHVADVTRRQKEWDCLDAAGIASGCRPRISEYILNPNLDEWEIRYRENFPYSVQCAKLN